MKISNLLYDIGRSVYKAASFVNDVELIVDCKLDKWANKRINRKIYGQANKIYRKIRLK